MREVRDRRHIERRVLPERAPLREVERCSLPPRAQQEPVALPADRAIGRPSIPARRSSVATLINPLARRPKRPTQVEAIPGAVAA
ncbi:MAG: hypothetical protein U0232_25380 [Thermomicrobiales bacterium]